MHNNERNFLDLYCLSIT